MILVQEKRTFQVKIVFWIVVFCFHDDLVHLIEVDRVIRSELDRHQTDFIQGVEHQLSVSGHLPVAVEHTFLAHPRTGTREVNIGFVPIPHVLGFVQPGIEELALGFGWREYVPVHMRGLGTLWKIAGILHTDIDESNPVVFPVAKDANLDSQPFEQVIVQSDIDNPVCEVDSFDHRGEQPLRRCGPFFCRLHAVFKHPGLQFLLAIKLEGKGHLKGHETA